MDKIKSVVVGVSAFSSILGTVVVFSQPKEQLDQEIDSKAGKTAKQKPGRSSSSSGYSSGYSSSSQASSDIITPRVAPGEIKAEFALKIVEDFQSQGEAAWKKKYIKDDAKDAQIKTVVDSLKFIKGRKISVAQKGEMFKLDYHHFLPLLKGEHLAQNFEYLGREEWVKRYIATGGYDNNLLTAKLQEAQREIEREVLPSWRAIKWELWMQDFANRNLLWKIADEEIDDADEYLKYAFNHGWTYNLMNWKKLTGLDLAIEQWIASYVKDPHRKSTKDKKWLEDNLKEIDAQSSHKKKNIAMTKFAILLADKKWNKYSFKG